MAPSPAPVALDILLLPGPRLAAAARALNAALVAAGHPAITFGPQATPHLTLAQLFVAPESLARLAASLRAAALPASGPPLAATGLGAASFAGRQALSIVVETTPALVALHDRVRALAAPFATRGDAAGFFRAPGAPEIHPGTVAYASDFLARHAGPAWAPHVTVGLAEDAAAGALLARPFTPVTEPAAALALWRLGEYGTAAEPLAAPA
jgi:hypothetical protein